MSRAILYRYIFSFCCVNNGIGFILGKGCDISFVFLYLLPICSNLLRCCLYCLYLFISFRCYKSCLFCSFFGNLCKLCCSSFLHVCYLFLSFFGNFCFNHIYIQSKLVYFIIQLLLCKIFLLGNISRCLVFHFLHRCSFLPFYRLYSIIFRSRNRLCGFCGFFFHMGIKSIYLRPYIVLRLSSAFFCFFCLSGTSGSTIFTVLCLSSTFFCLFF